MKRPPPRLVALLTLLAVVAAGVLWDSQRTVVEEAAADIAEPAAPRASPAVAPAAIEIIEAAAPARDPFYAGRAAPAVAEASELDERWPRVVGLAWQHGKRWLVVELPDEPARLVRPGRRFGDWRIDGRTPAAATLIHLPTGATRALNLNELNEAAPIGGVMASDETS